MSLTEKLCLVKANVLYKSLFQPKIRKQYETNFVRKKYVSRTGYFWGTYAEIQKNNYLILSFLSNSIRHPISPDWLIF